MKLYFKLATVLILFIAFSSCKNEGKSSLADYKFADKNFDVECSSINGDLLKEAVFSFEEDITNHFVQNGQKNLVKAYSSIINLGMYGRGKFEDIVSDHTIAIFKELKKDATLWNLSGKTKTLNYNHKLVKCLAEKINDKDLNTTFNALLSTNSMRFELLNRELRTKSRFASNDKHLATYIALDYFYAKLFDVDFDIPKQEKVQAPQIEK